MESAGVGKGKPSWQKAFDVSGRLQHRGGPNRLERGKRKTKCLSWRKACGLTRSRCRRGSGGRGAVRTSEVAPLYDRFTTRILYLVRVLLGSPNLTNLGTGGAWGGFHARKKPADYGPLSRWLCCLLANGLGRDLLGRFCRVRVYAVVRR